MSYFGIQLNPDDPSLIKGHVFTIPADWARRLGVIHKTCNAMKVYFIDGTIVVSGALLRESVHLTLDTIK